MKTSKKVKTTTKVQSDFIKKANFKNKHKKSKNKITQNDKLKTIASKNTDLVNLKNKKHKVKKSQIHSKEEKNKRKLVKKAENINKIVEPETYKTDLKESKLSKLKNKLNSTNDIIKKTISKKDDSLRSRMMEKLKAAHFRLLNEKIYSESGGNIVRYLQANPEELNLYHEGYRQQTSKWPLNPIDVIIGDISKMPPSLVIADMGCGDAALAKSVTNRVHSFDIVANNPKVIACDMAKVPLKDASVDIVVFCLSLMSTNIKDYILEANRILKKGGFMKIAEVESRFDNVDLFIKSILQYGFGEQKKNLSHNLFYFLNFKKVQNVKKSKNLPIISLNPCMYKKR